MRNICAWCRKPGATQRVALVGDDSVEGYRHFCSTQHANDWNNLVPQPAPPPPIGDLRTASFFDILAQANREGWRLLGVSQPGPTGHPPEWRVSLQKVSANGTTQSNFTDYAEATDARAALLAALHNGRARDKHAAKRPAKPDTADAPGRLRISRDAEWLLGQALAALTDALRARRK